MDTNAVSIYGDIVIKPDQLKTEANQSASWQYSNINCDQGDLGCVSQTFKLVVVTMATDFLYRDT